MPSDAVDPAALIRYLTDLARLRNRSIIDVAGYDSVLWFSEVPKHRSVRSALVDGQLSNVAAWLVIDRVELPPRPEHSGALAPWLEGAALDRADREPVIRESITVNEEVDSGDGPLLVSVEHTLVDHPDITTAWAEYLERWRRWAAERRELEPVHATYTELFRAAEHLRQVGEQLETVVAVGLLLMTGDRGPVRRHLLTAPAQVTLDAQSGRITIEPAADVPAAITLEQDMVAAAQTPSSQVQGLIRDHLAGLTDPLDLSAVTPALEMWVHGASSEGRFEVEQAPGGSPGAHPVVRLAPALVIRPRSQAAVLDTYNELLDSVTNGGEVPPTFADLTTTGSGELSDAERADNGLDLAGEQWFPLPANSEQAQIVEALRRRRGVIVHGPPGTGKSHTIANLIAHAMASGQRVLVTSHAARALEVLADKLPEDIRSLTVTMLGQGRRGTDDLERSANEILRRRQDPDWKPGEINDRLTGLRNRLEALRAQRSSLLKQLGDARNVETDTIELGYGGYSGTRAELALRLQAEPAVPDWIPTDTQADPPLTQPALDALIEMRRRLTDSDLERGRLALPAVSAVPAVDVVAQAINEFVECADRRDSFSDVTEPVKAAVAAADPEIIDGLADLIDSFDAAQQAMAQRGAPWLDAVTADLSRGNEAVWKAVLSHSATFLANSESLPQFDRVRVELASGADRLELRALAAALLAYLDDGGTIRRVAALNPKVVKDAEPLFATVRVDGAVPDDPDTCRRFISWCDQSSALEVIEGYWPPGVLYAAQTFAQRRAAIVDAHAALSAAIAAHGARTAATSFVDRHSLDMTVIPATRSGIQRAEDAIDADRFFAQSRERLVSMHDDLASFAERPDANPTCSLLHTAIAACDPAAYSDARSALDPERQLAAAVSDYDTRLAALGAVAPTAVVWMESAETAGALHTFVDDWNRSRAWHWLRDLERSDANAAARSITDIDDQIRGVIRDIGANQAWLAAIGRLTDRDTQHLKAYQTAMKRVGKGGSKFDFKYRQEARAHLSECQGAIPAWIMPAYQVAATMPRVAGLFDLVVIDEASQSGVEELFLFWLGKQVVVVGDKQQISPEGSFVKGDALDLQRRHLDGWSFAGEFGPENSLFDVAEVKYVSGEVWLSEHFRCMPEIIEYSNKLCYADHRLEPVRQFGEDRLPPLRRTYVPSGPALGSGKTNRDEADAIVNQIIECVTGSDYEYPDGTPMTMGVISLFGPEQAKLIQNRLLAELDSATLTDRRIHVGDASDFQGDERDVIFLSMVKTPNGNGTRLSKLGHDRDSRRFNVAASRARDQLWLFHSVTLDDLNPDCPRARLITHMDHPGLEGLIGFEAAVDTDRLTPPFESLFEQRVFMDLVNHGFVVRPQWKVLGYRLDLVVVGADARLAVEVDGDFWHGPDKYADDLARQGDLERVGWRFARVKEWEYYTDKSSALQPVFDALAELNIGPGATRLREPTIVKKVPAPSYEQPAPLDELDGLDEIVDVHESGEFDEASEVDELDAPDPPAPRPADEPVAVTEDVRDEVAAPNGLAAYDPASLDFAPDPNATPTATLAEYLLAVVRVEGPVVAERAYQLINAAAGNKRMGHVIRAAMQQAADHLVTTGRLLSEDPLGDGPLLATLRLPDQPTVDLRHIGPRPFHHVPPREIAAMLESERQRTDLLGVNLYRRVHHLYGHSRMREGSVPRYEACERLLPVATNEDPT